MEKIDYEKEFLSIYNKFNQKYSKWEVWKDFFISFGRIYGEYGENYRMAAAGRTLSADDWQI